MLLVGTAACSTLIGFEPYVDQAPRDARDASDATSGVDGAVDGGSGVRDATSSDAADGGLLSNSTHVFAKAGVYDVVVDKSCGKLRVSLWGAGGGPSDKNDPGGPGGFVSGTLDTATTGGPYTVTVGAAGGGGAAGAEPTGAVEGHTGGAGGGHTSLSAGSAIPLLIAGGGGGACYAAVGGAGGGQFAASGNGVEPGRGGSLSDGGAGGGSGQSGSALKGGHGGDAMGATPAPGGGGGSGWFGGGGGAGSQSAGAGCGSGGGGSGFVDSKMVSSIMNTASTDGGPVDYANPFRLDAGAGGNNRPGLAVLECY